MDLKQLEKILYFEAYVVIDPGDTSLKEKELLTEEKYREYFDQYGSQGIRVGIGAEAIRTMLEAIDLEEERENLRSDLKETKSEAKRKK